MNIQRGKITRDTNAGDGIISIQGRQTPFSLEKHWKSDQTPKTEMTVEVQFDENDNIVSVTPVSPNELLKEQWGKTADTTRQLATQVFDKASASGLPILQDVTKKLGASSLIAWALIVLAWFFLNLLEIRIFSAQVAGISFYGLLRMINTGVELQSLGNVSGGAGFYGLLCFVFLLLPALPYFWKNRLAWLGYTAPCCFMLFILLSTYWQMRSALNTQANAARSLGGDQVAEIVNAMAGEVMKAVSMGFGFYLALAAGAYLAFQGIMKFLSSH